MYEHKTIVDNNGYVVEKCVLFIGGVSQNFNIEEGQEVVEYCNENYIKPKWNGSEWIEDATDEEIQAWKEENKVVQEPTLQETLNAQLSQQNAEMQVQLEQQKQLNAQMLLQIAQLGGSTNV